MWTMMGEMEIFNYLTIVCSIQTVVKPASQERGRCLPYIGSAPPACAQQGVHCATAA